MNNLWYLKNRTDQNRTEQGMKRNNIKLIIRLENPMNLEGGQRGLKYLKNLGMLSEWKGRIYEMNLKV